MYQVGSNTLLVDPATGVEYRGREYPWGIVNIEDQVKMMMVVLMVIAMGDDMAFFFPFNFPYLECLRTTVTSCH